MELAPVENKKRLINYRPVFELAVGLMAGIAVFGVAGEMLVMVIAALSVASTGALLFFRKNRQALFAGAILFGIIMCFLFRPPEFESGNYAVTGVVNDITEYEDGTKLILKDVSLDETRFNRYAEIELSSDNGVSIGDQITCYADCRMPSAHYNTYNEYNRKLSSGIGCLASTDEISVVSKHNAPLTEFFYGVRSAISNRIDAVFDEDSSIFNALILGVRTEMTDERYSAYRASGTAHLLALSGFHMGIVSGAIAALIPKRKKNLKLIIVGAAMLVYCSVAAYAPGMVRAAIMSFCFLIADRFERRPDSLSSLAIAAILILSVNPYQLYSIGFQLSFSACFGIALFNNSFKSGMTKAHMPSAIGSSVSGSSSAIIGTLAFQMHYFNSLTPYAIICNLFAIPAFSFVVILGIISTLIGIIIPAAARIVAIAPRAVLFVTEKLLQFFSGLPGADILILSPPLYGCTIFLLMLFVFSEYVLRPFKKRMWPGLALMFLFTFTCVIGIIHI